MNTLYPIFIKAHQLQFLIVGGGYVALEKLEFLYKSSPAAQVTMVAPFIRPETLDFIQDKPVKVIQKKYRSRQLKNKNIVSQQEYDGSKDALKWAARTYLVAALGSLAMLLYWGLQVLGSRD